MVDEMNGIAYIDKGSFIVSCIRNEVTYMTVSDNCISSNERPFYHGLLMNRQQVQQIIDNKHLFDNGLVNAAYLLLSICDGVSIEYQD